MKNVLISAYAKQNLGDDMFITYLCHKYPNINFHIFCETDYQKAFKDILNLNVINDLKIIDRRDYDMQIVIGGSIFMQSSTKSIIQKYSIDKKTLLAVKPTCVIGANFGPYTSIAFLALYKQLFKKVEKISFRDEYSYKLFQLKNIFWAPDILFNYPLPDNKRCDNTILISCIKKNSRSGLIDYDEDIYIKQLTSAAECYSSNGFKISLACFSKIQEDHIAAQTIYNNLSHDAKLNTEIIIYNGNINNFLKKFLSASYIIGTRFHSVILGLSAGIPVFPICYNSKLKNALLSYEFKGNYIGIDKIGTIDFSYIDLNRKTNKLININNLKQNSNNHFEFLDKILEEKTNE